MDIGSSLFLIFLINFGECFMTLLEVLFLYSGYEKVFKFYYK